jgi:hypothetical protein
MTSLSNTDIGSIVYSWVSNIPTNISGILPTIINQQIYFVENKLGIDIPITAVEETYQPPIFNLTIAGVLKAMEAQGIGTSDVKIGELSITKGLSQGTSKEWKEWGIECLNDILNNTGEKISYYQCWG